MCDNEKFSINGTGLDTSKCCKVYSNISESITDTQWSGWPNNGRTIEQWTPFSPNVLTKAPSSVSELLNNIAKAINKIEKWDIGVCAEVWCLLRGLELKIAPKDIRITEALGAGGYLYQEPCRNCKQWLEPAGYRTYRIKDKFLPQSTQSGTPPSPTDFPAL